VNTSCRLFAGLSTLQKVLLTHGDSLTSIAPGFIKIATSSSGIVAGIANEEKQIYGVQFHPESDETEE